MKIYNLKDKLIESIKTELKDEKNLESINDLFKPIIHNILSQIYPYIILFSIIIISILLFLIIILIRSIYYN
tara:strand:+ start:141 stop:356 length:216 start_codon:yes stop_codon:yes gene_type:complete